MGISHHVIWLTTEISQENYGAEADFHREINRLIMVLFFDKCVMKGERFFVWFFGGKLRLTAFCHSRKLFGRAFRLINAAFAEDLD